METTGVVRKIGKPPSMESLRGVRYAMARVIRAMRDGKRDIETGAKLVSSMHKLAAVIVMEQGHGLAAVPDAELEAEVERRAEQRTPPGAEAEAIQ